MSTTIVLTLHEMTCCRSDCGITFAVPSDWVAARRKDHSWFYCPNGHTQHYSGTSDAERAKASEEALARERARHDQTKAALAHEERSKLAVRGHLSRVKNRIAAGVCPCCNRTFQDLARHMAGQHPAHVAHGEVR